MPIDLDGQMHAAELAGLRAYAAAVFSRATSQEPEVVSLAFTVREDSDGLLCIEAEYLARNGMSVGGFGL